MMRDAQATMKRLYWSMRQDPLGPVSKAWRSARRSVEALGFILTRRANRGECPICQRKTLFIRKSAWLRDNYLCLYCRSIPRSRAIIHVLQMSFPEYRSMAIHESSASGPASEKLRRECKQYVRTNFYGDVLPGSYKAGIRCEDLEHMTFADESFDLVITQDVLEHVLTPANAFAEIARTLRPGGAHVFTVPYYLRQTRTRAMSSPEGIVYLAEKDYHLNPISEKGALVVTEWGIDICDYIYETSRLTTTIYQIRDPRLGLDGEFLEVFVSRKGHGRRNPSDPGFLRDK